MMHTTCIVYHDSACIQYMGTQAEKNGGSKQ